MIPAYDPKTNYGFFGYPGAFCHYALTRDDPQQLEECWQRGWIDLNTPMLIGSLLDHCDRRAPKCGAKLRELGPCRIEPRKPEEFIAAPAAELAAA